MLPNYIVYTIYLSIKFFYIFLIAQFIFYFVNKCGKLIIIKKDILIVKMAFLGFFCKKITLFMNYFDYK